MRRAHLWVLALLIALAASVQAQDADTPSFPAEGIAVDRELVADLLRELVPQAMAEADIPGAAVAVAHAGEIVLLEGFGYADVETRIPVDPERTVFRLGSISKPLAATTILAVLEEKDLDLDLDVRPLLEDLDLRPDYARPLTLRQLLTHTAGFNENLFGQHARRPEQWLPLDRFLAAHLPPRFAPPGKVIAYTDFHTSLAGLVAARLAGVSFEVLTEERLFGPLGMTSSTFRQVDLPAGIEGSLAKSYGRHGGELTPYPRDYVHTTPAAGLRSTAADMARYLIALTDDGRIGSQSGLVMSADSWRTQKTIHHRHHELLDGKGLGLTEVRRGGRTLLYKDGQASGFHARFLLAPEERLAVFSVHNRSILDPLGAFNPASRFHRELGWKLFDALLPEIERPELAESLPAPGTSERLPAYEGVYRTTVTSRHTLEKIISMTNDIEVQRIEGDRLRIAGSPYVEIEPGLMQYEGARFYVSFAPPEAGRSPDLFVGAGAYERIPWYESSAASTRFAIAFSVLFLVTALFFSWRSWRLRPRRAPDRSEGRRLARAALAVAVLCVLFLPVFGAILRLTDPQYLFYGWPWSVRLALVLPLLAALAMVLLGRSMTSARARRQAGLVTAVLAGVVLLGGVAFLCWLHVWNLLGWRL